MKNTQTRAFTLVELLITITILALIAVVGYTSFGVRQNNAINSKVTSEIETLTNALLLAKQEKSELPLPKGNLNFFAEDTSYVHNYTDTETFAAHGFITHDTLPKKYIDVLPVDPRTGSFYAYGKTKWTGSLDEMYEIAGVIWKNDTPTSYVTWDYTAEVGPFNLIRSYNWPDFVWDKSDSNFPYNPIERILTAKIDDYSGTVLINGTQYSESKTLSFELRTGDTVETSTGWTVELYFSDWSRSVLWDSTQSTKLTLQKMNYKQENNLVTDVKLILESGMIWNKAASLDEESEFEIYTVDSTAAVRWTIFWIQKNGTDSQIVVKQGSVAVQKNTSSEPTADKISYIKESINTENKSILTLSNITSVPWLSTNSDGESVIEVKESEPEVWIEVNEGSTPTDSNTGSVDNIPNDIKEDVNGNSPTFNDNISLGIQEYSYNVTDINIDLIVPKKVYKHADVILVKWKGLAEYKIIDLSSIAKESFKKSIKIHLESTNQVKDINKDKIIQKKSHWKIKVESWSITENESWEHEDQTFLPSLIHTTHANTSNIDLLKWVNDNYLTDLEFSFGKYTPRGDLRVTRGVRLTLIEDKDYDNEDEEEKRDEEVKDFEREEEAFKKNIDAWCDGFEFDNISWQTDVCADADDDLKADSWNLVAYAPYDHAWDLYLYKSNSTSYNIATNFVSDLDTNWIAYKKISLANSSDNGDDLSEIWLTVWDTTDFNKDKSYVKLVNLISWIFLTTRWASNSLKDYLQYKDLNLSENFALESNLFIKWNNKKYIFYDFSGLFKVRIRDDYIQIYDGWYQTYSDSINVWEFNNIIIKVVNNRIWIKTNRKNVFTDTWINYYWTITNLYVWWAWNGSTFSYQLNAIINNFKIYTP